MHSYITKMAGMPFDPPQHHAASKLHHRTCYRSGAISDGIFNLQGSRDVLPCSFTLQIRTIRLFAPVTLTLTQ